MAGVRTDFTKGRFFAGRYINCGDYLLTLNKRGVIFSRIFIMKTFKYSACDTAGSRKEGLTQANSPNDVIGWLRERGLTPVSIQEIVEAVKQAPKKQKRKRIKSAEIAALCWQLTTMVEGGIPITTALKPYRLISKTSSFRKCCIAFSKKCGRAKLSPAV